MTGVQTCALPIYEDVVVLGFADGSVELVLELFVDDVRGGVAVGELFARGLGHQGIELQLRVVLLRQERQLQRKPDEARLPPVVTRLGAHRLGQLEVRREDGERRLGLRARDARLGHDPAQDVRLAHNYFEALFQQRDLGKITITTDIKTIAVVYEGPYVFAINPKIPATTLKEFVAYAKSGKKKLNYASIATGSNLHLVPEMFKEQAGFEMQEVSYNGKSGEALMAVMTGEVDLMVTLVAQASPQIDASRAPAAQLHPQRDKLQRPELEALHEEGDVSEDVGAEAKDLHGVVRGLPGGGIASRGKASLASRHGRIIFLIFRCRPWRP